MQIAFKHLFTACILCCTHMVNAVSFQVVLDSITKIKASETHGDELYFVTTEFSSHGDASSNRVPTYPIRWLSKELDKVQNVILWEGDLLENEAIQLQMSLIEMDVSPWNVDDLIGTAKIKLKNEGDFIRCDWLSGIKKTATYAAINKITRDYHFERDGAIYSVVLTLRKS